MIEVKHEKNKITVSGHAGYAPIGQDIVCAAFSAVLQTFVASTEELTNDEIKAHMAAGKAVIEYGDLTERGQLLLSSFFVGVRGITNSYPQHIKIV
jgi:uncharacterized protein YsxB (DUF464 family)